MPPELLDIYSNQATIIGCIVISHYLLSKTELDRVSSFLALTGLLAFLCRSIYQMRSLIIDDRLQKVLNKLHKINNSNNEKIIQELDRLLEQIERLDDGKYSIYGIDNVMRDDITSLKQLQKSEELRYMTPLPRNNNLIERYVQNKLHLDIVQSIANCSNRNINSRVVYVLSNPDCIPEALMKEIEKLKSAGVQIKAAKLELIDQLYLTNDIIVFGISHASIGKSSYETGECNQTTIFTRKNEVKRYISLYEKIWNNSMSI